MLLEQKVPATYLALEDVVNHIAAERRMNGLDPVLNAEQYRTIVTTEMQQRFNRVFRDWAELHQATLFLHDNGKYICTFEPFHLTLKLSLFYTLRGATSLRRRHIERPLLLGPSMVVRYARPRRNHPRN